MLPISIYTYIYNILFCNIIIIITLLTVLLIILKTVLLQSFASCISHGFVNCIALKASLLAVLLCYSQVAFLYI